MLHFGLDVGASWDCRNGWHSGGLSRCSTARTWPRRLQGPMAAIWNPSLRRIRVHFATPCLLADYTHRRAATYSDRSKSCGLGTGLRRSHPIVQYPAFVTERAAGMRGLRTAGGYAVWFASWLRTSNTYWGILTCLSCPPVPHSLRRWRSLSAPRRRHMLPPFRWLPLRNRRSTPSTRPAPIRT